MTMQLHNHFTTSRIRASFTASTFDHFSNRPNTWGGEEGLQPSIHRSTYLSTCLSIYLSIYLEYKRSSSTCMNSKQILERNPHLITLAQSLATRCSIPSSAESAKKKALILPTTREAKTGFDCLCLWEDVLPACDAAVPGLLCDLQLGADGRLSHSHHSPSLQRVLRRKCLPLFEWHLYRCLQFVPVLGHRDERNCGENPYGQ